MGKKTIIICTAIILALAAVAAAGIYFLASGRSASLSALRLEQELPPTFKAIPVDAVAVMEFPRFRDASDLLGVSSVPPAMMCGSSGVASAVAGLLSRVPAEHADALAGCDFSISLHYSGKNSLSPLLVFYFDDSSKASALERDIKSLFPKGTVSVSDGYVIASDSKVLVQLSARHISEGISLMDNSTFLEIALASSETSNIYVNHTSLGKFFSGAVSRKYLKYADFFKRYTFWSRYSVDSFGQGKIDLCGINAYSVADEAYAHVYDALPQKSLSLYSMVPHYASFILGIPVGNIEKLNEHMDRYFAGKGNFKRLQNKRDTLAAHCGIHPLKWASKLDIKELASVRCAVAGSEEFVSMIKCGKTPQEIVFPPELMRAAGRDSLVDMSNYAPFAFEYRYKGYLESMFGEIFSHCPEQTCAFVSGWLVIGSSQAIDDFIKGAASELTFDRYISDAGLSDVLPSKALMSVTLNLAKDPQGLLAVFKDDISSAAEANLADAKIAIVNYSLLKRRSGVEPAVSFRTCDYEIPKASRFDNDTVVEVPKGPWKVINSGTGRVNVMEQQKNHYISLKEENGKGIWSAPFDAPVCGYIEQVDYFENGKLQMIFASGSRLYLLDRLGRMVRPFPVSLGKEVLLGPEVYDFNNDRKYNVMILHKDNTLGLYDLKGNLRDDWKGFRTDETIKCLPQLLEVNSSLYWVVTTSRQSVICDFSGTPVADFSGNKMIRPGEEIRSIAGDEVEFETYSGKRWRLNLKTGRFSKIQ